MNLGILDTAAKFVKDFLRRFPDNKGDSLKNCRLRNEVCLNIKKKILVWLPWLIIAWGLYYRFDQYIFNRSLWLDEALVAVNVINRTFSELLKAPLEYSSYIAPPGFLLTAKLATVCFGNSRFNSAIVSFLLRDSFFVVLLSNGRALCIKKRCASGIIFLCAF